MCGITGHWAREDRDIGPAVFEAFTDRLAHRGPDDQGAEHFVEDRLWLGHRRLTIIDTSERGHQPMSYGNGRYWLTYNGEIYNFLEIRAALMERGHSFATDGDSEVILAAYDEWGADCQLAFNGMWAFAIWDARKRELFLSRDRFGVKPLHYANVDGSFMFASEMKAFLELDWCDGELDDELLAENIWNVTGLEATEHALLRGVKRLPAGHCMTVDGRTLQVTRWWDTRDHLPEVPRGLAAQTEQFRALFLDSCRLRLRSDVPIATSLSGGLDSSAVACAITELGRQGATVRAPADWQQAFVACFPETTLDERGYAEQVVASTGLRAHFHTVSEHAMVDDLERIVFELEDIFTVPLAGAWVLYREMRRAGIRVSLDGHGADELLGGYHSLVEHALNEPPASLSRYRDLRHVHHGMVGGADMNASSGLLPRRTHKDDMKFLAKYGLERFGLLDAWRRRAHRDADVPLLAQVGLPPFSGPRRLNEPSGGSSHRESLLQNLQYEWFHEGLLPTFLRCIDRAAMAHGIEVRSPFMDWRLVTFGFALPDESRIGGGYTKRILREAMRGLMPDPVRLRTRKIPFSSPLAEWSRGALREWLLDLSTSRNFLEDAAWNGKEARNAVQSAVAGHGNIAQVWPIVNAHILREQFRSQAVTRPLHVAVAA